jgi:hypothetical protein
VIALRHAGTVGADIAPKVFRRTLKAGIKANNLDVSEEYINRFTNRASQIIKSKHGWSKLKNILQARGAAKKITDVLKEGFKHTNAKLPKEVGSVKPTTLTKSDSAIINRAVGKITGTKPLVEPSLPVTEPPVVPPVPTQVKQVIDRQVSATDTQLVGTTSKLPLTGKGSAPQGTPQDAPIEAGTVNQDYEILKDAWFSEKDWQAQVASIESANLQDQIKATSGEKGFGKISQDIDKAIQINIDLKRNPGHLAEFYNKLTLEQQRIVNLSQNLNPGQQAIADEIAQQNQVVGNKAIDAEIIKNTLDNYAARVWDVKEPKKVAEVGRKFGVSTRHAKARKFETIIEGWANGFNLKVEGATNNLAILKEEINNTIQDKKFLDLLTRLKDVDGNPVLSTAQLSGYDRIEHPNFKKWKFAGQTEPEDLRGKNFMHQSI